MKIHHLNCSTFCPLGGHLIGPAKLVCHCLLIESEQGLILVDSGLGLKDVRAPKERMSGFFRHLLRPQLLEEETAHAQIKKLGFDPKDVRHILLTHLDFDHAGGVDDFPSAEVHVLTAELRAAEKRKNFISRGRYRPSQLSQMKTWNAYSPRGERWFGFNSVREMKGLPPEILMIPLVGHTEGHAGIAIETDKGWLLHAGDAYFYHGEMALDHSCTPGLRGYQKMMEVNRQARLKNQQRLRKLALEKSNVVKVFCAHDQMEFDQLKSGPVRSLKEGVSFENVLPFHDGLPPGLNMH